MTLELLDPTGKPAETGYACAPRLQSLDGLRIGLFANGKVNADKLLRLTAAEFARRHGCEIAWDSGKPNASRIADPQLFEDAAANIDFLITAVGD